MFADKIAREVYIYFPECAEREFGPESRASNQW
jgi:hypothetical protein